LGTPLPICDAPFGETFSSAPNFKMVINRLKQTLTIVIYGITVSVSVLWDYL
jgi:hypothetical protein